MEKHCRRRPHSTSRGASQVYFIFEEDKEFRIGEEGSAIADGHHTDTLLGQFSRGSYNCRMKMFSKDRPLSKGFQLDQKVYFVIEEDKGY